VKDPVKGAQDRDLKQCCKRLNTLYVGLAEIINTIADPTSSADHQATLQALEATQSKLATFLQVRDCNS